MSMDRRAFLLRCGAGAAAVTTLAPELVAQRLRRLSSPPTTRAWSPLSLPGLLAWYSASSGLYTDTDMTTPAVEDGAVVAAWADLSGNGYHLLQSTSGNRPTLVASGLNSKPVVSFASASSQWLRTAAGMTRPTDHTISALFKADLTAQNCICSTFNGAYSQWAQILAKVNGDPNGAIKYYIADGVALNTPYITQAALSSQWTLFTAIWKDGASAPCELRVNSGSCANRTMTPVNTTHNAGASNVFCVGRNGVSGSIYGTFQIAELFITSRSIT